MNALTIKKDGIHYTPPALAHFLTREIIKVLGPSPRKLKILDPACGDGSLLSTINSELPAARISKLIGFDTSAEAIKACRDRLQKSKTRLEQINFLDQDSTENQFDVVIANPPFVRTQVLGQKRARQLAKEFGLTGRIDLYHAFAVQIARSLTPGGVLGLITSNRFLTTKSGASMRALLQDQFSLKSVFDLGDTRLFGAAVLPAVLIAVRNPDPCPAPISFTRVYRKSDAKADVSEPEVSGLLDQLSRKKVTSGAGSQSNDQSKFKVEEGMLDISGTASRPWSLSNTRSCAWLKKIRDHQVHSFGDLAQVKVGIKTTADAVFVRQSWAELGGDKPERKLLRPLITHHCAQRWSGGVIGRKVLYPYAIKSAKRTVVDLETFPQTKKYLQSHRKRLAGRKYVTQSGRQWFEIWVPHQPSQWKQPKIVWPDISEQPKFFLDTSGAVVNGDCYWIKLKKEVDPDWLYMMLAVANSDVATTFYDTVFHNKLYANRRRFMTQYVKEFPLPDLNSKLGKQIVRWVKKQVEKPTPARESKLESLVQRAFGFSCTV